jgi:lipopolysaccharide/colanic/teichoic acid biosynthesis glycosyltransferase
MLFKKEAESGWIINVPSQKAWFEKGSVHQLVSGEGYLPLKRLMDILLSIVLLIPILSLLAVCIIAIKLNSRGPAFFTQERTGKGEQKVKVYKLRTMVKNAAQLRDKYLHLNELRLPDFKISRDPRVTRVGSLLRRFSLDELPQIFNVLKGDLSLVGPRPSSYDARTYKLWHSARFELKPGITGLAQIMGRSDLLLDDKVRYDIAYLNNVSLWLDLRIIMKTIKAVFKPRGVK